MFPMPKDLQEVLLSAARVYNLDITALTVRIDTAVEIRIDAETRCGAMP